MFKLSFVLISIVYGAVCWGLSSPSPSVFKVADFNDTYTGTAFELQTLSGKVTITNAHICGKEKGLIAILPDGSFRLVLVKSVYSKHDLCLLTSVNKVQALTLADDYQAQDPVSVDGFPEGIRKVTQGYVGGYTRQNPTSPAFSIYHGDVTFGSSGSPVIDKDGKVIGVLSQVDASGGHFGLFVTLEYLKDFVDNYR